MFTKRTRRDRPAPDTAVPRRTAPFEVTIRGDGSAYVDGEPLRVPAGEPVHIAVLDALQRHAQTRREPVEALVLDGREGGLTHLEVAPDGSSRVLGQRGPEEPPASPAAGPAPEGPSTTPADTRNTTAAPQAPAPAPIPAPVPGSAPVPVSASAPVLAPDPAPTSGPVPAPAPSSASASAPAPAPFSDSAPAPAAAPASASVRESASAPAPVPAPAPAPASAKGSGPVHDAPPAPAAASAPRGASAPVPDELAELVGLIGRSVDAGALERAAALAFRLREHTARTFGARHPYTLESLSLEAFVAHRADNHLLATVTCLELARIRHRDGDPGARAELTRALAAWQLVDDEPSALEHGKELLALWSEVAERHGSVPEDAESMRRVNRRIHHLAVLSATRESGVA